MNTRSDGGVFCVQMFLFDHFILEQSWIKKHPKFVLSALYLEGFNVLQIVLIYLEGYALIHSLGNLRFKLR